MTQKFNRKAYDALLKFEVGYLKANGWKKIRGKDSWSNTALDRFDLPHGHAVNVQKQRDRMSAEMPSPMQGKVVYAKAFPGEVHSPKKRRRRLRELGAKFGIKVTP